MPLYLASLMMKTTARPAISLAVDHQPARSGKMTVKINRLSRKMGN
jgi:hypothetical protein